MLLPFSTLGRVATTNRKKVLKESLDVSELWNSLQMFFFFFFFLLSKKIFCSLYHCWWGKGTPESGNPTESSCGNPKYFNHRLNLLENQPTRTGKYLEKKKKCIQRKGGELFQGYTKNHHFSRKNHLQREMLTDCSSFCLYTTGGFWVIRNRPFQVFSPHFSRFKQLKSYTFTYFK